jgi:hypothetical protein
VRVSAGEALAIYRGDSFDYTSGKWSKMYIMRFCCIIIEGLLLTLGAPMLTFQIAENNNRAGEKSERKCEDKKDPYA